MTKNLQSFDLAKQASNGSVEPMNPLRRQYCRGVLSGMLVFAGCGGGGSSDDDEQVSVPTGNVPPASGAFGGGEGKILFVEGVNSPRAVYEIDLASRQVREVASISGGTWLVGGVTRANTGSFLIMDKDSSSQSSAYLFGSDGVLLRRYEIASYLAGAVLSPDGRSFSYAGLRSVRNSSGRWQDIVASVIVDVESGNETIGALLGFEDPPLNKTPIGVAARAAWSRDSALYAAIPGGLYRVDRSSGQSVKIQDMDAVGPIFLSVSPNGQEVWYESEKGSPHGTCFWSIDIRTGEKRQRTLRSQRGRQNSPGFSPDGQWVLMQQDRLGYTGLGTVTYSEICAVRLTGDPLDTQELVPNILTNTGDVVTASGRMAWY